jgi:hypothetical protein
VYKATGGRWEVEGWDTGTVPVYVEGVLDKDGEVVVVVVVVTQELPFHVIPFG